MPSNGLGSLLWFIAVLALIPVSLWFLKRTPLGGAGAGAGLRSIAALPLSTSQRIVTVEVGQGGERRWLVLGVTPQSISVLHTMTPPEPSSDAPNAASSSAVGSPGSLRPSSWPAGFAETLRRLRGEPKDPS